MNEKFFIPIIVGTGRKGSSTAKAAHFIYEQAQVFGFNTELIEVSEYVTHAITGAMEKDKSEKAHDILQRADGVVIVSPEYNHGYPGELKLFLDQFYDEYARKPVGICGVSGGRLGGSRMVEALRTCVIELQMVPLHNAVYFGGIKGLFNEAGDIIDESYKVKAQTLFEELAWYAGALKRAKQ